MDIYCEYIVKGKKNALDYVLIIGAYILAFILSGVFFVFSQFLMGLWLLLIVGVWFGAYVVMKLKDIEYEYTLTNTDMDIDIIYAKKRRKNLIIVDFKNAELCANVKDERFTNQFNNPTVDKILDCTGNNDNDIYFVDFVGQKGKFRVLFQPSERMKEELSKLNMREVNILWF